MSHEADFATAFTQCLAEGVYPGPVEINQRLGKGRLNQLNGRDSKQRLKLMEFYSVPYLRGGAYGAKGEVPRYQPKHGRST